MMEVLRLDAILLSVTLALEGGGGFDGQAGAAGRLTAWSPRPGLFNRGTVDRICWMVRLPA